MAFKVLTPRPQTERTGEHSSYYEDGRQVAIHWERVKGWRVLGIADSYEQAREKFGGRPVLEWIGSTH